MKRLGILLSGRGSNFEAIADQVQRGDLQAEIAVVISNRADAAGLDRARERGLTTVCLPSKNMPREVHDRAVVAELQTHQVDLVCLAGYMRLLTPVFIQAFPERILNIHPSLLPSFPGLHAVRQALAYGVKIAGCTVHVVTEEMDAGPILRQAAVPILEDDTEDSLAARILVQEHRLYPEAIRAVLERLDSSTRVMTELQ